MSFSFRVKAESKEVAKAAAKEYMADIVKQQPIHAKDADCVLAATNAYIDLLVDLEEGDEVIVTVSGSLSWHGDQSNSEIVGANIGMNVALAKKQEN